MVNSKQKGASFEREVCVALSLWLSDGAQEDVFWRSAMSGGRSTVAFKRGKRLATQVGDITCIHPLGQKLVDAFALECKAYSSLDYQGLLTGKGNLLAFWAEITEQARRYEKQPMLFARQNRLPTTVCLTLDGLNTLGLGLHKTVLISRPHDIYILLAGKFFSECIKFV